MSTDLSRRKLARAPGNTLSHFRTRPLRNLLPTSDSCRSAKLNAFDASMRNVADGRPASAGTEATDVSA